MNSKLLTLSQVLFGMRQEEEIISRMWQSCDINKRSNGMFRSFIDFSQSVYSVWLSRKGFGPGLIELLQEIPDPPPRLTTTACHHPYIDILHAQNAQTSSTTWVQ